LQDTFRTWGTTPSERLLSFPCDDVVPDANEVWHRGVDVRAAPEVVCAWLCQLRVAPYSYDWIDNFGRRSPRTLTPELQRLEAGQIFMRLFELASFETNRHVTVRLPESGRFPPSAISYVVQPQTPGACRLLVKLALRLAPGWAGRAVRWLGPGLDLFMMRRQLLNLKGLAEGRP
jgi:hypothetical protein